MTDRAFFQTIHLTAASACLLLGLATMTGCRIEKDKSDHGNDNVKIATPFGGLNVRSDGANAASIGLPEYPGARTINKKDDGDDGSVDLHMGFGPWQMHIQVASYGTDDSQDKVVTFYRKALSKYGDVLECEGNNAVGATTRTSEGLTCADHDHGGSTKWNKSGVNIDDLHLELKTGSRHHQHIVGFKQKEGQTRFSLIALDLPNTSKDEETN
jgi:hypothetical protein